MKKTIKMVFLMLIAVSFWFNLQGQTKQAVLTGKERVTMFAKHKAMKEQSSFKDLHWQYIGPTNISGRCTDVEAVIPRGDSYTIWVGSASGGVWRSDNEGSTFQPVFDDMPTASIGDIAIDPGNPDVVWVGTGEANIFRSSNAGCGVFKTTDGGKTWKNMGLDNTMTIGRIRIHPKNTDIVYVAATGHEWTPNEERGLFKTTDGGKTWEKILYLDDMTGAFDLVLDPNRPNTIYCTTWERMRLKWNDPRTYETTKNSAIWKSTNGGRTWEKIIDGLPEPNKLGRIGIDIAVTDPDILYALVDNYEIAYPADPDDLDSYGRPREAIIKGATVYRTDNGGRSWRQVSGLTPEMKTYMERHSGTYGWVFGQIRVDPTNENTIYILGVPLSKSTDGGKTFERLRGPHADHHGMWIDPANGNYILNVQDGGLTITYDQGESWKYPIEELPLAQFYNIEYDMSTPFRVFGSIQDHHSFYTSVDLSHGRDNVPATEWEHTLGAEGTTHAVNKENNNTIYASSFYGNLARAELDEYPQGQENILPTRYSNEPPLRGQWVAPTMLSPHNQDIVYHCMQYVLMSKDRGDTWEYISPDLTYNDPEKMGDISYQTISAFDESPLKFGLLYAGTDDGRVWRTKDGGNNWTEIRSDPVPLRWVSRITVSMYDLGTVYMTQTGRRDDDFQVYIWKSTDFGDTWTDISGNIPVGPVNVIREDPVNRNILYVGTDAGVYVSKDGGENYEALGDLPYAYVHDLQIHPRDNMIIIATHGRGMFVLDANDVNDKDKQRQRRWY
ncbi:MAG: hypothetical protein U9N72_11530 [Bacteroidota bacterium]|nr:hypothetical protein [Bacteroidota bacterium]